MPIRLVVTRGYGNGTFPGTINDVTLRGYSIGSEPTLGGGSSDPPLRRKRETRQEAERRRKFYHDLAKARRLRGEGVPPPAEEAEQPSVAKARSDALALVPLPKAGRGLTPPVGPQTAQAVVAQGVALPTAEDIETRRLAALREEDEALLLLLLD